MGMQVKLTAEKCKVRDLSASTFVQFPNDNNMMKPNPANTPAKKEVSVLDSRNLNADEKGVVKSVSFAAVICLK